jgi:tetratricopeptide (TPR) repeat protein
MGLVYTNQGDFQKAMESYLKALKIAEAEDDKTYMSAVLGNLGILNEQQKNYDKALEYELKALKLYEGGLNNKTALAADYGNIGVAYQDKGMNSLALLYYFKYLNLAEEIGNKNYQGTALDNIGIVYADSARKEKSPVQRDSLFTKALDFYSRSVKMDEETRNKNGCVNVYGNIGHIYFSQANYESAYNYYFRALALADSIGAVNLSQKLYELISELYEKSDVSLKDSIGGKKLGMEDMRLQALHYYKSGINLKDTLFSQENRKELLRKELNYDFEKKESETKAQQDKKDLIAETELKQKEHERNYFIAGFALVILLALFIFRGYRQKQKANEIISYQKVVLEEKQKEILDSIHYAKRIQQSILPSRKYISKNLNRLNKKS